MIHKELCKWLKFAHIDKQYMHRLEFIQENSK